MDLQNYKNMFEAKFNEKIHKSEISPKPLALNLFLKKITTIFRLDVRGSWHRYILK